MISDAVQVLVRGLSAVKLGANICQLLLVAAFGLGLVFIAALALRFLLGLLTLRARRRKTLRITSCEVALWTLLLGSLLARLLVLGLNVYADQSVAPANSYDIKVLCSEGKCEYLYPNRISKDRLVVPLGQPVRLIASATDHPYTLRMSRANVRQTAVPGRYSSVWFTLYSNEPSSIRCERGCGSQTQHQSLLGVSPRQFEDWSSSDKML